MQSELNHSRSSLFPTVVVGQLLNYTMLCRRVGDNRHEVLQLVPQVIVQL